MKRFGSSRLYGALFASGFLALASLGITCTKNESKEAPPASQTSQAAAEKPLANKYSEESPPSETRAQGIGDTETGRSGGAGAKSPAALKEPRKMKAGGEGELAFDTTPGAPADAKKGDSRPAEPNAAMPPKPPEAAIDPNGRFATTYRPGGGHLAAFESAVARGIVP